MKKIIFVLLALSLFSCAKPDKNPLIIPPHFADVPDLNNIDKNGDQKQKEDVDVKKLKELLL